MPFLTIGIPTYNRPEGLEKVIQYLIKQDYQHLEIIISDNCSPNPRVKEILEHYAALDHRIRYFIQAKNIEAEPNFNFVFHQAKGDYFMWMADDDIIPDEVLRRRKEAFSDGVSQQTKSWFELIQEHIDTIVSDQEYDDYLTTVEQQS